MRMAHNLPVSPPQPPNPSAEVIALRTNWKWAYLSHFLFTYNPMLRLEDIHLSELEDDLANGTFHVLPTVVQRLLTCLTPHDKRSILENWQHHLRKQSLRRDPDHNVMGTEDHRVDFSSLIMTDKLHILQSLCEWQFHNPNNLRTRMKDDDDYAAWRMEPIAYDAKGNAYWLMGGNRLWLQYAPPRKRNAISHKRKQPTTFTTNCRGTTKRGRGTAAPPKPVVSSPKCHPTTAASTGRPTRSTRSRVPSNTSANMQKARAMGTRVSSRLRGREEEEVWQSIPEEWLKEGSSEDALSDQKLKGNQRGRRATTREEITLNPLDDVSELTSLSDLSDSEAAKEESSEDVRDEHGDEIPESPPSSLEMSSTGEDTWDTVCVTLADWEAFPERFEKSTHRGEKAFYKLLINDLVPMITEVLRVDVRKKHMEEAVVHRKRSSRIAVKESIRESERAEARRKAEEEKELERHKRWEARARKEEESRLRREASRAVRLRESGRDRSESVDVDVHSGEPESKPQIGTAPGILPATATPVKFIVNGSKTGTHTPKDDDLWELDCEICHRRGVNLDDGLELMSCERCNKWQHIRCHDQADFIAGKPRRNWDIVDFLCASCSEDENTAHQERQLDGYSQVQPFRHYNGTVVAPVNGTVRSQPYQKHPDNRTGQPNNSASKTQTGFDGTSFKSGRTAYAVPKQPYPTIAALQSSQRLQLSVGSSGNAVYSASTSSQSNIPTPPYNSTPNMYLSNYASNLPSQNTYNVGLQPQNPPSPSYYRGQKTTMESAPASTWPQQRVQYNNLATWSGPPYGLASTNPGANTPHAYQNPQQNGYYRSRTAVPSSTLVQQLASVQRYSTGGPSFQP